jgi:predicted HAD superfamily Cof-like phosphohydrolase
VLISHRIHTLAEQAAQAMQEAAEATAHAQQLEQQVTALARELDDLLWQTRAQETEVARIVSENVELRHACKPRTE